MTRTRSSQKMRRNYSAAATRNPRRNGLQYNTGDHISGDQLDDGVLEISDEDVYDFEIDFLESFNAPEHQRADMTVSILAIARPAKEKGTAKDFEIVQRIREVITLEDNADTLSAEDDEWEAISDEQAKDAKASYSSILRRAWG